MTITLTLPWPSPKLNPNARCHWRAKLRDKQWAHLHGYAAANEWLGKQRGPLGLSLPAPLSFTFCPPDKRARDLDNLVASQKDAVDGIARALNVNDALFRPIRADWGEVRKGGAVVVEIGA